MHLVESYTVENKKIDKVGGFMWIRWSVGRASCGEVTSYCPK